ncbi:MAG: MerR family DNA-binding transcriptional regulator, partial [Gammaproteobacteria bacterium]
MLTIGSLGKKTGTKVQTIRYYEQIGLMPEPGRTEGGQRRYGYAEVDRLSFIRHA